MSNHMTAEAEARVQGVIDSFKQCEKKAIYTDVSRTELMVSMADGVKLRTIITRPSNDSAYPCILSRTCYPHDEDFYLELSNQYAMRGIAFVVQYCRGMGGSEGVWEPNVNERADGKSTADWLCSQKWVTCAGYWGSSYLALTGWIIADIVPQKMKTMYLTLYGTDRHVSAYQDGLFRHDVLTAWTMAAAGFPIDADYIESCLYLPHVEVDEGLWGHRLEWYRKWVTSTDSTDEYWQTGVWKDLKDVPSKIKIPISMSEGWYDHHLGSAIKTWDMLSDESRVGSEFVIGPWNHWFEAPLEDDDGKNYECNDILRAFEWFERILVKKESPKQRVSQYIVRGDYWVESKALNKSSKYAYFFLSDSKNGSGLVDAKSKIARGERRYTHNPENPIYSHGGETLLRSKEKAGSLLMPDANYRDDVISFVSDSLCEDLSVCGQIKVRLFVSSRAGDTAFAIKIIDENKDGKGYFVRSGITTLAYRGHSETRQTYTPDELVEIEIDTWDIGWLFKKGHKIRIDIQSSDFPQYNVHSNCAGVWSKQTKNVTAEQCVYFSESHPSRIELPLQQS